MNIEAQKYLSLEDLELTMSDKSVYNLVDYFTSNLEQINYLQNMIIKSFVRNKGVNPQDLAIIANSVSEYCSDRDFIDMVFNLLELIEHLELEDDDEPDYPKSNDMNSYLELNSKITSDCVAMFNIVQDKFIAELRYSFLTSDQREELILYFYELKILEILMYKGYVDMNTLAAEMAGEYCRYSEQDVEAFEKFKKTPDLSIYNGQIPEFAGRVILGGVRGLDFKLFCLAKNFILDSTKL